MMQDGELWGLAMPARRTCGKESGLWPTPISTLGTQGGRVTPTKAREGGTLIEAMSARAMWPTPRAAEAGPDFAKMKRSKTGISLQTAVAMWPTPRAGNPGSRPNGKGGKILAEEVSIAEGLRERGQKFGTPRASHSKTTGRPITTALADAVMFATPKSRDWKGQSQRGIHAPGDALPNMDRGDGKPIGGSLNPTWVEWLMGWPLGWTDCVASAMDRFHQWLLSHGIPSLDGVT
jgi:hypothetical protein